MSIPPPSASARHARDGLAERRRVTAVLGPTNTGKTHLAIERMMGHETGMIGLPLRLLAREVYDRVARAKGARHVALITGEEKILPRDARYFVCTVEAMPSTGRSSFWPSTKSSSPPTANADIPSPTACSAPAGFPKP